MRTPTQKRAKKPEGEKLKRPVQVLLTEHEFKIFDRIRREAGFPSIAAYARMIFLKQIEGKKQTELF